MAELHPPARSMLLMEPELMLRRTVALTARSIGVANIVEAANAASASKLLRERVFDGAVIAVDAADGSQLADLALLDELRSGDSGTSGKIPIAVLAERCDAALVLALRQRDVTRVIVKPFRARTLLETFSEFAQARKK